MKTIIYYLLLLIFIALLIGWLIFGRADAMAMNQMIAVSAALVLYTVAMSLVGEGVKPDERQAAHRNLANRAGLIAGLAILCTGAIVQLFLHQIDYWLLSGLIVINLSKIISLVYLENRN